MDIAMNMLPTDLQMNNEYVYSRKHIDGYIQKAIKENPDTEAKVAEGVKLLNEWMNQEYYVSKNQRLSQLKELNLDELVRSVFTGVAYCVYPELFVSVTAQLASRMNFDDKQDSITTMAEITAVLCHTDAFDIIKENDQASLMIQSTIPLPDALLEAAQRAHYLPPMVCEPATLTNNYESPYLTHNDCLILGKQNGHSGNICLDTINLQNNVALELDTEFLTTVEELPTFELDTAEKLQLWSQFIQQSHEVYALLVKQGNHFWLTNKVDKRGRMYAEGYHVTTQGSSYKKAMIELKHKEIVKGVPYVQQSTV